MRWAAIFCSGINVLVLKKTHMMLAHLEKYMHFHNKSKTG
jgi:hypothetical protein